MKVNLKLELIQYLSSGIIRKPDYLEGIDNYVVK